MTKFCEDCPLRGRATGEIKGIYSTEVQGGTTDILTGKRIPTYQTEVGVILDEHRNPSAPIRPGVEDIDSITDKVDGCEGPNIEEQKRFFRKPKSVTTCPAIGRLSIEAGTRLYDFVAGEVAL